MRDSIRPALKRRVVSVTNCTVSVQIITEETHDGGTAETDRSFASCSVFVC